jgi:hypothetical protein
MPFIHIKSLPFEKEVNISKVLQKISWDFSHETGIDEKHVIATWEFYHPFHYAYQGKVVEYQNSGNHPILVDLLAPDFNDKPTIEKMLKTVASSIARLGIVPEERVFINYRCAHSGMVLDEGGIVEWE